mgnify:CR=1 FL=1
MRAHSDRSNSEIAHRFNLVGYNYLLCRLATEIVVKDHYWVCKDPVMADSVRKTSGNAIDFFVEVEGLAFSEAMDLLLSVAAEPATP